MHARSWSAGKTGVEVLLLADEAWVVGAGIGVRQEEKERVHEINSRTGRDATCCCLFVLAFSTRHPIHFMSHLPSPPLSSSSAPPNPWSTQREAWVDEPRSPPVPALGAPSLGDAGE